MDIPICIETTKYNEDAFQKRCLAYSLLLMGRPMREINSTEQNERYSDIIVFEKMTFFQKVKKKVRELMAKEVELEMELEINLQALTNKCPPITKRVCAILVSILLGLLVNCIYDGIKSAVNEMQMEKCIVEENSETEI